MVAARKAFGGWSGATAYNRGQILYRIAEMLEGRRDQYVAEVADAEGLSKSKAAAQVDAAIDRWVWYAGWTDKIAQVVGGGNPVAGPFFNLSSPEPTGVVAVLAPQKSSFLGLVSVVAPVIATGNTAVVVASEKSPSPPSPWARSWPPPTCPAVWSTSSPAARRRSPPRSPPTRTSTRSTSRAPHEELAKELEIAAADNLKRVLRPQPVDDAGADWSATPGTDRMTAFLETKTVWHPTGALGASGSSY